jgi:hypothetical protein
LLLQRVGLTFATIVRLEFDDKDEGNEANEDENNEANEDGNNEISTSFSPAVTAPVTRSYSHDSIIAPSSISHSEVTEKKSSTFEEIDRLRESISQLRADVSSGSECGDSSTSVSAPRSQSSSYVRNDFGTVGRQSTADGGEEEEENLGGNENLEGHDWQSYLRRRKLVSPNIPPTSLSGEKKKSVNALGSSRRHNTRHNSTSSSPSDLDQLRDVQGKSPRLSSAAEYRRRLQQRTRSSSGYLIVDPQKASPPRQSRVSSAPDVSSWTGRPLRDNIDEESDPKQKQGPSRSSLPPEPPVMSIQDFQRRHEEKLKRMQSPVTAKLASEAEAEELKKKLEREKKRLVRNAKKKKKQKQQQQQEGASADADGSQQNNYPAALPSSTDAEYPSCFSAQPGRLSMQRPSPPGRLSSVPMERHIGTDLGPSHRRHTSMPGLSFSPAPGRQLSTSPHILSRLSIPDASGVSAQQQPPRPTKSHRRRSTVAGPLPLTPSKNSVSSPIPIPNTSGNVAGDEGRVRRSSYESPRDRHSHSGDSFATTAPRLDKGKGKANPDDWLSY